MAKKFFTDESLSTLISKIKEFVTNSAVTPDWNAAEGEPGHVLNRTHYSEPPKDITWDGDMTDRITLDLSLIGEPGYYLVKVSDMVPTYEELIGAFVSANTDFTVEVTSMMIDNTVPGLYMVADRNLNIIYNIDSVNAAMGIPEGYLTNGTYFIIEPDTGFYVNRFYIDGFHKLDRRFLPSNLYPGKVVEGETFVIDETEVVAGNGAEIFNNLSRNIATGFYSHAEGAYTTASGKQSHAEGSNTTASGDFSHAEGWNTTASGGYSHAEGSETTASGFYSHAEGYGTTANGRYSHAEGAGTTASEYYSHAEGYGTTASGHASHAEGQRTNSTGNYSHTEGFDTTASAMYSHAEGAGTTASGEASHVQGQYNIEDTEDKYAHIVGNGTTNDARSNAHTLDWDGNAWFAGDIYIGGTGQDDPNAKKLGDADWNATEGEPGYIENRPFGMANDAVLLKHTGDFTRDEELGIFYKKGYVELIEGKTYTVRWYNTDYTTIGTVAQYQGEEIVIVGNPAALGGEDNGLPFAIGCNQGVIAAIPLDGSTSVYVGITGYGLKTIPEEYLPGPYRRSMVIGVTIDADSLEGVTLDNAKLKIYSHDMTFAELNNMIYSGVDVTIDFAWTLFRLSGGEYPMGYDFYNLDTGESARLKIRLNDYGMTLSVVDEELITVDDIDEICGVTIEVANLSEVEF